MIARVSRNHILAVRLAQQKQEQWDWEISKRHTGIERLMAASKVYSTGTVDKENTLEYLINASASIVGWGRFKQ